MEGGSLAMSAGVNTEIFWANLIVLHAYVKAFFFYF
jgi:hypothetical protein